MTVVYAGPVPLYAASQGLERPIVLTQFGAGNEQRSSRSGRTYRSWNLAWLVDVADRRNLDAFFVALGGRRDSFYWRNPDANDPDLWSRQALALGVAAGGQTVFPLPTGTSEYAGDYPIDDATTVLFADGVAVARTVQTDARTITANAAPGAGKVMTASYQLYRRVRFDAPLLWTRGDHGLWAANNVWREVNT